MNDSTVSRVAPATVLQQQAYILFYVKMNSSVPKEPSSTTAPAAVAPVVASNSTLVQQPKAMEGKNETQLTGTKDVVFDEFKDLRIAPRCSWLLAPFR